MTWQSIKDGFKSYQDLGDEGYEQAPAVFNIDSVDVFRHNELGSNPTNNKQQLKHRIKP